MYLHPSSSVLALPMHSSVVGIASLKSTVKLRPGQQYAACDYVWLWASPPTSPKLALSTLPSAFRLLVSTTHSQTNIRAAPHRSGLPVDLPAYRTSHRCLQHDATPAMNLAVPAFSIAVRHVLSTDDSRHQTTTASHHLRHITSGCASHPAAPKLSILISRRTLRLFPSPPACRLHD